jgi:hypothetical protein
LCISDRRLPGRVQLGGGIIPGTGVDSKTTEKQHDFEAG